MINNVVLAGRTTGDIELKKAGDTSVANFTLAINRQSNRQETDFIDCVAFGKTAETISKYVFKGHKLGVIGRIQKRSYTVADGQTRYIVEVVAERIAFLQGREEQSTPPAPTIKISDEDLPF